MPVDPRDCHRLGQHHGRRCGRHDHQLDLDDLHCHGRLASQFVGRSHQRKQRRQQRHRCESNDDSNVIPANNAPQGPQAGPTVNPPADTDTADDADTNTTNDTPPSNNDAPEDFFGDVDGDGVITGDDVMELLTVYGVTGQDDGDLNDDGMVDLTDIAILLSLIE